MSSSYEILHDRPLDKWKVKELKEELKKRKLASSGLKRDLIRRLNEAIRTEREKRTKEVNNGLGNGNLFVGEVKLAVAAQLDTKGPKYPTDHGGQGSDQEADSVKVQINNNDNHSTIDQGRFQNCDMSPYANCFGVKEELAVSVPPLETSIIASEKVASDIITDNAALKLSKAESLNEDSKIQNEQHKVPEVQFVNDELKPPRKVDMLDSSTPNTQVSKVSPNSTNSLPINNSTKLDDNTFTNKVNLVLDTVEPKFKESSSTNVVPDDDGKSHQMDIKDPQRNNLFIGEKDENRVASVDANISTDTADIEHLEQLNLDSSSGDDFVEDDTPTGRLLDSTHNFNEMREKSEKESEDSEAKVETPNNIVTVNLSAATGDADQKKNCIGAGIEKRNLNEIAETNDCSKRQKAWNIEGTGHSHRQLSDLTSTITPQQICSSVTPELSPPKSDCQSGEETYKKRVVPPSQKPSTNSLRIDNFVRPFTLKAVQELLGKTGNVTCFWMDHVKTHCYVTYSSVAEANATRNAVYNLQWPPHGGQLLVCEFVDPQEVKMQVDQARPHALALPITSNSSPQVAPSQHLPPLSNPFHVKECVTLPPAAPRHPEKDDSPIDTLDDLFCKTKATPRIYYLPLCGKQLSCSKTEGTG